MSKFKVGQVWVTRDGRKARILATDLKRDDHILAVVENEDADDDARTYYLSGRYYSDQDHDSDLIREHREPREWWVNLYADGSFSRPYETPESAFESSGPGRIECIRVREVIE